MKIGLIGPESSVKVIQQVVEQQLPDISLKICCSDFFEDSAVFARTLQKSGEVDGILFTGPTNYAYAKKRVTEEIPWVYLPHNRVSVLQALSEAGNFYGRSFRAISLDRYSEELVQEVLMSIGAQDVRLYRAPYNEEEPDMEKNLLRFHRECYRSGKVTLCMTSMEHILGPLRQEGIPCIRIHPAKEIVQEQIYHLRLLNLSAEENRGKLTVIAIRYDYIFDDERDLFIREWEKVRYQNEFKERVYAIGQRLNGAVFVDGIETFFIATTRDMLENVFLKNHEHSKLLEFGHRSSHYKVWLGIGVGNTMLETKSRAHVALNRAIAYRSGSSYLVEDEERITVLQDIAGRIAPTQSMEHFAEHVKLGTTTLKKIAHAVRADEPVTSDLLAEKLGITSRSANRMLARLEDSGCIHVVGKQSAGKGRPARVIQITLPDVFYETES